MPGNTKTNPREHVNVVTLRSGKELEVEEKQGEENNAERNKRKKNDEELNRSVKEYKPKIPYPTKVKKDRMDE